MKEATVGGREQGRPGRALRVAGLAETSLVPFGRHEAGRCSRLWTIAVILTLSGARIRGEPHEPGRHRVGPP